MRDINFYIDTAKEKQGLKSDNALNKIMGFKGSTMSYLRLGKSHLSDEKMMQLAHLGGLDETTALMDLNIWRASTPETQKAYAKILHRLSHASLTILLSSAVFMGSYSVSNASDFAPKASNMKINNIYYGKYYTIFKLWIISKRNQIKAFLSFPYYNVKLLRT